MSNYLAIATVTEVLAQLVLTSAEGALGKTVALNKGRPADPVGNDAVSVCLYLYQVTPNAALRNDDLPTRSADGRLLQRPQAALDLHYLLAFYGDDGELEPQRMLGAVLRDLHAVPVLSPDQIRNIVNGIGYLAGSNLAEGPERVRFTPVTLSLEESSKLWSIFFQTKHVLSVAYQGSVVLVESEDTPQQALPVSERTLSGTPYNQPEISQLRVVDVNGIELPVNHPIQLGSRLLLKGRHLRGRETQVLIGDARIDADSISDNEIRLPPLPAQTADGSLLRAGIRGLQIMHSMDLGIPPQPHPVIGSNVMPFLLRPEISLALQGGALRVQFTPWVGKQQRVILILNELSNNDRPNAYRLNAPAENGITDINAGDTESIDFPLLGVAAGSYLVRVQVDGAESVLSKDSIGLYTQPQVTVP